MNAPYIHNDTYGFFDDSRHEYVITTPLTPRPWENRLWNDHLAVQVTNHGTAIVYERDHQGRFSLYNWSGNRALYIRDLESGDTWSPAWFPVNADLDSYQCRHGLNYTIIAGERQGIHVTWETTVHECDACEIWRVNVTNRCDRTRRLLVVPFYELDLTCRAGNANRFTGAFDAAANCLYVCNEAPTRVPDCLAAAWHSNWPITRFELDRDAFLRSYSCLRSPAALHLDRFDNSMPDRSPPVFAVPYRLNLPSAACETLHAQIYSATTFDHACTRGREYGRHDLYAQAIAAHARRRAPLFRATDLASGNHDFDRYATIWVRHQHHYNAEWNRGWAMGFRDAMQDADAWRMVDPSLVRKRLLEAACHIYRDGHTVRKWAAIDDTLYLDGGIWFVNCLVNYLRETGDLNFLRECHPWLDGGSATILDHARRTMDFLASHCGPNGLCRMGYGDWNDALNGVDRAGRGESVWTSMATVWALRQLVDLLNHLDDPAIGIYAHQADALTQRIDTVAFDGDRYIRAITDDGTRIGSRDDRDDRIFLNPQSWAIIAGIADDARRRIILQTVARRLETPFGPLLLDPPFTAYDERLGRISADQPGRVENGANYVHASLFHAYALTCAALPDAAFDLLCRILPSNPANPPQRSQLEPFSLTNAFEGTASAHPGRAMFPWRTGSAAWFNKVLWDGILSIVPDFHGLRVQACLPSAFRPQCRAVRTVRGNRLTFLFDDTATVDADLHIDNGDSIPYSLLLDGMRIGVRTRQDHDQSKRSLSCHMLYTS